MQRRLGQIFNVYRSGARPYLARAYTTLVVLVGLQIYLVSIQFLHRITPPYFCPTPNFEIFGNTVKCYVD